MISRALRAVFAVLAGGVTWLLYTPFIEVWLLAVWVAARLNPRASDIGSWRLAWRLRREVGDDAILDAASLWQACLVSLLGIAVAIAVGRLVWKSWPVRSSEPAAAK